MGIVVVTPPSELPVTVSGIKEHLRIQGDAEDALLSSQLFAATEFVEDYLNRSLVSQTLEYTLSDLPNVIELPRTPVQSVVSITVVGDDDSSTVVESTAYKLDTTRIPHRIVKDPNADYPDVTLSHANPVTVRFVTGYGSPDDVPESFKAAIKLLVGNWYENREAVVIGTIATRLPFSIEALLAPHRVHYFSAERG